MPRPPIDHYEVELDLHGKHYARIVFPPGLPEAEVLRRVGVFDRALEGLRLTLMARAVRQRWEVPHG